MTTFEKLQKRIEKDCGIALIKFRRTYAGHWQKSNGNWIWGAYDKDNESHDIGSIYTATELLKSKHPLLLHKPGFPFADEIVIDEPIKPKTIKWNIKTN